MNTVYLISAGCSYGISPTNHFFQDKPIREITLYQNGAGMGYIKESIIRCVDILLNSGVDSNNIFVFTDYTQIGRPCKRLPKEFNDDFIKSVEHLINDTNHSHNQYFQLDNEELVVKMVTGYTIINDTIYSLFQRILDDTIPKYLLEWEEMIGKNYDEPISIMENYLSDIFTLQSFLKNKNVDHLSFFMNNTFEGWYKDEDGIVTHEYSTHPDYSIPNLSNTLHIKQLSPLCNSLFNSLDLSKIIFYKSEGNEFGGIDEFTIDNFDITHFKNTWQGRDYGCTGPRFGLHPDTIPQRAFLEYGFVDKFTKFLEEK